MRKLRVVITVGCWFAMAQGSPEAVAATRQPKFRASVQASHPAYTVNGPQVVLTFTVTNTGTEPADPNIAASQLFINGRDVTDWAPTTNFGFGPRPTVLKPGQSAGLGYALAALRRYFARAGVYRVRWTSTRFQAPELKVRVAADRPTATEPATTTLLRRIRGVLPTGWEAYYAEEYKEMEVVRIQATPMERRYVPNDNPFAHQGETDADRMERFDLGLYIQPLVAPVDFARLKADNDRIHQEMATMYVEMRHINHKFDSFLPGTDAEKEQVARYERLQRTLHDLPTYYFRDISLTSGMAGYGGDSGEYNYRRVIDKTVRRECAQVTERVKSVLTRYEPEPPATPDTEDE